MFNNIIKFFKGIKSDFMEGYTGARVRSSMGWSYNLKQYWRKKK